MIEATNICKEQDDSAKTTFNNAAANGQVTKLTKSHASLDKCVNVHERGNASKFVRDGLDLKRATTATIDGEEAAHIKNINVCKAPTGSPRHKFDGEGKQGVTKVSGHLKRMVNYYDQTRPIVNFSSRQDVGIYRAEDEYLHEWLTKEEDKYKQSDVTIHETFQCLMSATITNYGPRFPVTKFQRLQDCTSSARIKANEDISNRACPMLTKSQPMRGDLCRKRKPIRI